MEGVARRVEATDGVDDRADDVMEDAIDDATWRGMTDGVKPSDETMDGVCDVKTDDDAVWRGMIEGVDRMVETAEGVWIGAASDGAISGVAWRGRATDLEGVTWLVSILLMLALRKEVMVMLFKQEARSEKGVCGPFCERMSDEQNTDKAQQRKS